VALVLRRNVKHEQSAKVINQKIERAINKLREDLITPDVYDPELRSAVRWLHEH
jgi:hypothetical protein